MEELAEILHEHNLIFSAALSPGKPTIDIGYDIPRVRKRLPWWYKCEGKKETPLII